MNMNHSQKNSFQTGYVAIIGKPNVGKSTLLNRLLNQKLAIVSPRPQTTRNRILGILNGENYQAILLDTPGLMEPQYLLQQSMAKTATSTMEQADLILFLMDATGISPDDERIMELLKNQPGCKFLAINKIDLIDKKQILPLIDICHSLHLFQEIIPISALKSDGLESLMSLIAASLPQGEPLYPGEQLTDESERFFVSEIIREKIYSLTRKELPYSSAVTVNKIEEIPTKNLLSIMARLHVETESQKGILIGHQGRMIKAIGSSARLELEKLFGVRVYLDLTVRVDKNWSKDTKALRQLGY